MSSFLATPVDYARHNDEVRRVMEAFDAGKPIRVPLQLNGSITNYFQNPELNTPRYTFEQFFTDPEVQSNAQLNYQYWRRHNLLCDYEMGLPDKWYLGVDFQNSLDGSWAGGPLAYQGEYLPDTLPIFDKHKEKLYDMPKLLPIESGLLKTGIEFIDYMEDYCRHHEYMGRPIVSPHNYHGEGTDGVLDLAYKLRGAANLMIDMLEDEEYYADLMEWITNNLIHRMTEMRRRSHERWGTTYSSFFCADDAITMISHSMYKEYVLPYHKRLVDTFGYGEKVSMHLCGNDMQHFGGLTRELNIGMFDTGFPVDFDKIRQDVGDDVLICGGPTIMTVKDGTPADIRSEVQRILSTQVAKKGNFIMIAANNMAPCTPVENVQAMYEAVHAFGTYPLG